ncbi:MAG: hypothetical protein UT90_C0017G0008 [Parcubacteria group bacterium GW2011_GWA1_40_21]|nr:MAG: hypothetical protein UT90_C0017G0008 [Parcubacteria group bacterium GW2011_GWA1_40_21]
MKFFKHISPGVLFVLALFAMLFFSSTIKVSAKVGVGMAAGEIRLTELIKPGGIYSLPSLRIFNTGDETTTYGMGVAYHQENPQLRPRKDWFVFSPSTFTIQPGESQEVLVTMIVPVKAEQGDYFAFIESGPVGTDKPGTTVGIAVATKLFFTVAPANIWQAVMHRASAFFRINSPWSWIGLGVALFATAVFLFRKFFSFNIGVRK